ncbi:hypothetical protein LQZ18_11820 [Lachnospiraceae bacterium ZAX-1]
MKETPRLQGNATATRKRHHYKEIPQLQGKATATKLKNAVLSGRGALLH